MKNRPLLLTGTLLLLGFASLHFFDPLRQNVPSFLVIYSILFSVFLYECRLIFHRDVRRKDVLIIILFSILFRFALLPTTPSLSDDIYRYVWDGRVQNAGINPYLYPPEDSELAFLRNEEYDLINHKSIRTVYPPLSQLVYRFGAALHPTVALQRFLFVLFDMGTILLLLLLLRKKQKPLSWVVFYAWNPLVIVEFAGSGHHDSLMLFFLVLLFLFQEQKRPLLTGAAWGLACLAKFMPLVLIFWFVFQKKWKEIMAMAGVFILGGLFYSRGLRLEGLSGLQTYAEHWIFNPSLYGWLLQGFSNPTFVKIGLASVTMIFCWWWGKKTKDNLILFTIGLVFGILLVSPVVHPWYVTWLVPLLCFYPLMSGLLWTGLVGLTYVVLIQFVAKGVWDLPTWVLGLEYGLIYPLLILELLRFRMQSFPLQSRTSKGEESRKHINVIIPALNEENAIGKVIADIPKDKVSKILVVDNGSKDNTPQVAKQAGAHVLIEEKKGYGRAVLKGLSHLSEDCGIVVILDGDYSDFPEDLTQLVDPILKHQADFVLSNRTQAAFPGSLTPQQKIWELADLSNDSIFLWISLF